MYVDEEGLLKLKENYFAFGDSWKKWTQAFAYKHIVSVKNQLIMVNAPMPYTLLFSCKDEIFELTQERNPK